MPDSFDKAVAWQGLQTGIFVKTPAPEIVELLALAKLDFVCFDTEHAAFSRRELDHCLGFARALSLKALVRVSAPTADLILQALDGGAQGVVVPHVDNEALAREIVRIAHFGPDGRGFSGSTRAAGYTTLSMSDVLRRAASQTLLIAQIESAAGLAEAERIAAVDGIDALFFGAADLSVSLGVERDDPKIATAFQTVRQACCNAGKFLAAFAASPQNISTLASSTVSLIFVGSEQSMILAGARTIADTARKTRSSTATAAE